MVGVWLFLCAFGFGYSSFVLVLRVVGFWGLFCVRMAGWFAVASVSLVGCLWVLGVAD